MGGTVEASAIMTPDTAEIRRDLEFMTARWDELGEDVMIEVRAFKEHAQPQIASFAPDWIGEAVEWIDAMNRLGFNIYAVRNPVRRAKKGAATDADVVAAFYLWADCDDPASAGNVLRFDGPKWSAAVTTGKVPSTRVHVYWRLDQPCRNMAAWRDMQSAIAAHFASDPSVINPSRIMRVGGTVSYPNEKKRAKGYERELTALRTEYAEPRDPVTFDQMARVFGAAKASKPAPAAGSPSFEIETQNSLDRDATIAKILSGEEWHVPVVKLVGSYVSRGLSDVEIHALTDRLTLPGYTVDQTRAEVQTAIDGARRKGWARQSEYAIPSEIKTRDTDGADFDTPQRPIEIEWFDDVEPSLTDSYLIKDVLGDGAMSVVYGPSNSGKTFLALDIAFSLAIGAPWQGRRVKQCAVLYLAAEGGRGVLNRIAALKAEHGVCDVPMAIKRAGMDLLHDQADLQHIVDLAAAVKAQRPGLPLLIVIDTLSRIMAGGDENSAADMTALIRNIDAIKDGSGAHVMLVHHTGKDAARGARGHSSLRAATDTEIEVANEDGNRAAMVTKQRDYQGGETFAFTLKSVSLGYDQDGDEVTSCVVETADSDQFTAAKAAKKGLGRNQEILLNTFDQMIADGHGKPNPAGVGLPDPGRVMCVGMGDLREAFSGKIVASNKRGAFHDAFNALSASRGILCMASELVWRVDRRKM